MDPSGNTIVLRIIIIVILLALSAYFSSAETALTMVNKIRMRTLADDGNKAAACVLKLHENKSKMLSAILIGNNVVNLSTSSIMTILAADIFGNAAVGIATGVLTILILIFGEITPKTMASLEADKIAMKSAGNIYLLMTILTPVIWAVNKMSGCILRLLHVDPNKKTDVMTEDELRTIVAVGHEKGVIETDEKNMINNVFDLDDSVAGDIMVPRVNMTFIDIDASYEELMEKFRKTRYTRFPVYQDSKDNVVGIINIKDLLLEEEGEVFSIKDHLRKPLYTFEAKKVSELMLEMRKTSNNIAVVLDEYGTTAGLITLEDILEEIVGDILDEYDEDDSTFRTQKDNSVIIDGLAYLEDVSEELGIDFGKVEFETLNGYLTNLLGHIPTEDDLDKEIVVNGYRFRILSLGNKTIGKVRAEKIKKEPKGEDKKCQDIQNSQT